MQLLISLNKDSVYMKGVDNAFSFVYYPDTEVSGIEGDESKRDCCEKIAKELLKLIEECKDEPL